MPEKAPPETKTIVFLKELRDSVVWIGWNARKTLAACKKHIEAKKFRKNFLIPQEGSIRVHLGCGDTSLEGYLNIDSRKLPSVDCVCDISDLFIFRDNSVALLYTSHVLEHIHRRDTEKVLAEWRRVLVRDGILRLSVPDFNRILEIYKRSGQKVEIIADILLGLGDYQENNHLAIFTRASLTNLLEKAGFYDIRDYNPAEILSDDIAKGFYDCSMISVKIDGTSIPVSLNLEARKA